MDRLRLNASRVDGDGRRAARAGRRCPTRSAPSVRGSVLPNGLQLTQVRVPLGVVAIIYEARPNVTVDAAGIALKAGNAALLRGSASAYAVEPGAGRRSCPTPRSAPGCPRTPCSWCPAPTGNR